MENYNGGVLTKAELDGIELPGAMRRPYKADGAHMQKTRAIAKC
jgi:hypothetical protein